MTDEDVREHLRAALAAATKAEHDRLDAFWSQQDRQDAEMRAAMAPVVRLLEMLAEEVGPVRGLVIYPADSNVQLQTTSRTRYFGISNYEGSYYVWPIA